VAAGLRAFLGRASRVRLVTLTIQHVQGDRLSTLLRRLRAGFRQLRKQPEWQDAIRGGVALVEISHGANGWHPHLHLLCIGRFIPHAALSAAWERVTGSTIVDVRTVTGAEVAGYVTKYLTKPVKPVVMRDPDLLDEAIVTLKGARMLQTFGQVRAADLEPDEDDQQDDSLTWIPLGRLDEILNRPADDSVRRMVTAWIATRESFP